MMEGANGKNEVKRMSGMTWEEQEVKIRKKRGNRRERKDREEEREEREPSRLSNKTKQDTSASVFCVY